MSVLFVTPSWSAPSELWMQRMIEAIAPHIGFIASYNPTEPTWRQRIPTLDLVNHEEAPNILLQAARTQGVSCILIHYLPFALRFEQVWEQTDVPLYVHCHGYDVTWDLRRHTTPHAPHFESNYPKQVCRLAKRAVLIANSHYCAQRLYQIGTPHDRVTVKYLGVPVPDAPPRRPSNRSLFNVLYLGRLVDFKGPVLTIRAFDLACTQGLNGQLILAGDGPLRKQCEAARNHSHFAHRISLVGAIDAQTGQRLRHDADLFTAHSQTGPISNQTEAFGVSFVEAMAAALPIVSGRSGSLSEIVTHKRNGLLVEPGDLHAHANALLDLASDPQLREQMGATGWQRARDRYSCHIEQARLFEILALDDPPKV